MKLLWNTLIICSLALSTTTLWAHSEHEHEVEEEVKKEEPQDLVIIGEVVDMFCYLSHGEKGLGKKHAKCARKCIKSGLPVGIKVSDDLYLAAMADHNPANKKLMSFAGQEVMAKGQIMERDGQKFIAITTIEEAPE